MLPMIASGSVNRHVWWIATLCASILVFGCDLEKNAVDKAAIHIKQVVRPGMTLDVATNLLRSEGFNVGDKYKPTDADYYQVNIALRKEIPTADLIKYTVGATSSTRFFVVIHSDNAGKIISVE